MSKVKSPKKQRVYEVAKELGMSSEAVLQIVRRLGVEVKNHMSTLTPDVVAKVQAEMAQEKTAVREEQARKQEIEHQRAREERARAQAAAEHAATQATPATSAPTTPAQRSRSLARPDARGPRRRDRKKKKHVDRRQVLESVRKTLASLGTSVPRRRGRRRDEDGVGAPVEEARLLKATEFITVVDLANLMEVKPQEVIAACMRLGLMATMNKRLDKDSIQAVADEFGYEVEFVTEYEEPEDEAGDEEETSERLEPRAPVVTVMGHVDHGKTSLLDYVRKTNVIAGESGGITQHIGAYDVLLPEGKKICFLDTPGHEAFTAMRARGAQITDIVVLVVAADDRVMPQTIEAIDHAKAAGVPIIVAINKIDLPTANPDRIKQELTGHAVVIEEYGGKTVSVEISAKQGTNIDRLLEMILLVSDLQDLKADPGRRARGVVIEARVEQGRGIVGSVLVQSGTLEIGDTFVAGKNYGRVRAMFDERGRAVRKAGPSTPVEVLGWNGTPGAGDIFAALKDERSARDVATKRQALHREHEFRAAKVTLSDFHSRISSGEANELKLVVKGDVDGSVEALTESLSKLGSEEVKVRIIRQAVGQITESDVLLAAASEAIIVGFHTRPDPRARETAEREHVEIRYYDVIYKAVEDVKRGLEGLLAPELKEIVLGSAEVRNTFKLSKGSMIAGCMVVSGNIPRSSKVRLLRDGVTVWTGRIGSLRRFKDDVKEVANGYECGIGLDGMNDVKMGDTIEAFTVEEMARTLG